MDESANKANWICSNYDRLKSQRGTWENHWQEIVDLVLPRKDQITKRTTPGEKKNTHLFDSTAQHALEVLASALHTMLTNPSIPWFDLKTGIPEIDERDDVRKWLQKSVQTINNSLNDSNFQTQIHEVYMDLGSIGTALLYMSQNDEGKLHFKSIQVANGLIAEDQYGRVNTVYYCFKMTGTQLINKYGEESFSEDMLRKMKADPMTELEVIQAVFPNDTFNPFKKSFTNKKYASVHVLKEDKKVIKEGGFKEFPFAAPRWNKSSNEIYGRSSAMKVLPDIKLINEVKRTTIVAAQKTIDPPLQAPDEGAVLPLKTNPGAINYYRAGTKDRIEPLMTGSRVDFGFQFIEDLKASIRQGFFIDQLQLNEGPQMTATEVVQRTEEKLRVMGPILGRLHTELLKPIIDKTFDMLLESNSLPEGAPEILKGKNLEIQYSSMIARSQKASEADNINRILGTIGPLIELDPNVMDNIDTDATVRHVATLFNGPQVMLRDKQDVEETRQAKAEMAQQQMQQEQEAAEVDNMSKLQQQQ